MKLLKLILGLLVLICLCLLIFTRSKFAAIGLLIAALSQCGVLIVEKVSRKGK